MKSYLIFLKNGEILVKKTNLNVFDITKFKDFDSFKIYSEYIVMYNKSENSELNITVLNFTTDRYNSDIGLLKIEKELDIKSLTLNNYIKVLEREKYELYEEDTDVFDITRCYKDIITF